MAKRNGKVGLLLVLCTAAFLRVQLNALSTDWSCCWR